MPALNLLIWNVIWMSWNALLALLPFLLAIFLFRPHRKHRGLIWTIGFIIFFLFLPNSPYLLTDIIHVPTDWAKVEHEFSMFVITWQYFILVVLGYWLFCKSYFMFENFVFKVDKFHHKLLIRAVVFMLISVGIYLGRFPRFNSWDVIAQPQNLLKYVDDLFTPHALGFTVLFTLLLFVIYYSYEWLHSKPLLFRYNRANSRSKKR